MTIEAAVEILKKHLGAAAFGRPLETIVREIHEAVDQPEKRETGYYWVRHNDILFWNGSAWYHGVNIYMDQDVTPVSDRLSHPVPNDTKHPDASIHPVIYINKNETGVYIVGDVDIGLAWCWRYATDWTAFKPGDMLPDKPGFVMFDNGHTVKVYNLQDCYGCNAHTVAYKVTDA